MSHLLKGERAGPRDSGRSAGTEPEGATVGHVLTSEPVAVATGWAVLLDRHVAWAGAMRCAPGHPAPAPGAGLGGAFS